MSKRKSAQATQLSEENLLKFGNKLEQAIQNDTIKRQKKEEVSKEIYEQNVHVKDKCVTITQVFSKNLSLIIPKIKDLLSSDISLYQLHFEKQPTTTSILENLKEMLESSQYITSLKFTNCITYSRTIKQISNILCGNNSLTNVEFSHCGCFLISDSLFVQSILDNKFLTKVTVQYSKTYKPNHQAIEAHLLSNKTSIKNLADFLFGKFEQKTVPDNDINNGKFFFYQKADKQLLQNHLKKLYEEYLQDSKQVESKVHSLLAQTDSYIAANYFNLRSVYKNPGFIVKVADSTLELPQFVIAHIESFLGKNSLWSSGHPKILPKPQIAGAGAAPNPESLAGSGNPLGSYTLEAINEANFPQPEYDEQQYDLGGYDFEEYGNLLGE